MSNEDTGSNESVTNTMTSNCAFDPVTEALCSETPFPRNLLLTAPIKSAEPSPETLRAAAKFREGDNWTVDNNNWEAALLALTERQPWSLGLEAGVDASEALPVSKIVEAVNRCGVPDCWKSEYKQRADEGWPMPQCMCFLTSLDTFYTATDVAIDKERVENIMANSSIRLSSFTGHLDHASIIKLPRYCNLSLAIGSAADAATISALRLTHLAMLSVSVTARVAVEDLRVLPSVHNYHLYFPFLSDDRVDSVRPAIEALLPNLKMWSLELPKCQLTSRGFGHLIEQLRGVKISYRVTIEASGTWRPEQEEKESLAIELYHAVACAEVLWGRKPGLIFPSDLIEARRRQSAIARFRRAYQNRRPLHPTRGHTKTWPQIGDRSWMI